MPSRGAVPNVKDNQALLYRARSSLHRLGDYIKRRLVEIVEVPSQSDSATRKEEFHGIEANTELSRKMINEGAPAGESKDTSGANGVGEQVGNSSGPDSPDEARHGENKTIDKGKGSSGNDTHDIVTIANGKGSSSNASIPVQQPSQVPPQSPLPSNETNIEGNNTNTFNGTQPSAIISTPNGMKVPENACERYSQLADKVCVDKVCLRTSRDGTRPLSLSITNDGGNNATVKVVTPEILEADRTELIVKNGTNEAVYFSMDEKIERNTFDSKGAKSILVIISTGHDECQMKVPFNFDKYPSFGIPMAGVYMLLVVLFMVAAVIWLFCRYRRRKRSGDGVKYQELVPSMRTPKEEENTDGWNEIWDDDWEDTEAARSSSRITKNLSSRGLAVRRGNKDEWDNTWDD